MTGMSGAVDKNTGKNMFARLKSIQFLLPVIFLVAFSSFFMLLHDRLDNFAVKQAETQLKHFLLSYKSVRQLVREYHKPEVYRLQEQGLLDKDYFSPFLLSTSFNARGFVGFLNGELEKSEFPQLKFRLLSDNPRNPQNQANPSQIKTLELFRKGQIKNLETINYAEDGSESLSISLPTTPVTQQCLKCHGKPEDAPVKMVKMYGDTNGFNETIGEMRAYMNVSVSLEGYYDKSHQLLFGMMAIAAAVMFLLYAVISKFIVNLEKQKAIISSQREELHRLSRIDKLTNILNRRGFEERAGQIAQIANRYDESLSLILFDIDFFKKVNDTYGHLVGDVVLTNVAAMAKKAIRASDLLCRWGGEEFLLLMPNTKLADAVTLAERMRQEIEQFEYDIDDAVFSTSASFGVVSRTDVKTLDDLIKAADDALYRAKNNGRNRVETEE